MGLESRVTVSLDAVSRGGHHLRVGARRASGSAAGAETDASWFSVADAHVAIGLSLWC